MRLIDLLEVLADNVVVAIWRNSDNLFLGCSDGRDSIDEKYNQCTVIKVYHTDKQLDVVLEV